MVIYLKCYKGFKQTLSINTTKGCHVFPSVDRLPCHVTLEPISLTGFVIPLSFSFFSLSTSPSLSRDNSQSFCGNKRIKKACPQFKST